MAIFDEVHIVEKITVSLRVTLIFADCDLTNGVMGSLPAFPFPPNFMETIVRRFLEPGGSCGHRRGGGESRFDGIHLPAGVHAGRAGPAGRYLYLSLATVQGLLVPSFLLGCLT